MDRPVKPEWKRWGIELRRLRSLAGISQDQLAKTLHVSAVAVSSWERGTRHPKRDRVEAADTALCTGGSLLQLWTSLNHTDEVPESWRDYAKLEQQATEIREYQPMVIPGLLQEASYIQAMARNENRAVDEEQLKSLIEVRTSRIKALTHTVLNFVIEEVAVRRVLGSPSVQRSQLDHLLHLIDSRGIRLSIVPEYAPHRPISPASFRIMTLDQGRLVCHAEHWGGQQVITTPTQVNKIITLFGNLQAEALPLKPSIDLITEIRKGL
jgi:transcriptional regulator with XRE-family HTH domain